MDDYYKKADESTPERHKTHEERIREAIHAVLREADDEADAADIIIGSDDDALTVRVEGYRLERGAVEVVEKQYEYSAEVTVTFTVYGNVMATSDIEADEKAADIAASIDVSNVEFDSDEPMEESGWGYSVDVDVTNVREA